MVEERVEEGTERKRGKVEMVGEMMEVAEMAVEEKEGVGKSWKQPEATHIVMYKRQETGTKHLNGRVACKLAVNNYGTNEWWLLLEPVKL